MPSAEPDVGLDPMMVRSWPALKSGVRCLTDWVTQVPLKILFYFIKKKFFLTFIHFFEREWVGEGRTPTQSKAGSSLWAVSTEPNVSLELTNHEIVTWAKVGCLTDWATQAPLKILFFKWSLHPMWGSDLQPRDQELYAPRAELVRCPPDLCFYI